jgi:proline dehydrogenase
MKAALKWNLPGTKFLIKHSIFERFCGGETIAECRPVTAELGTTSAPSSLVEGEGSDRSYDHTRDELPTPSTKPTAPSIPFRCSR